MKILVIGDKKMTAELKAFSGKGGIQLVDFSRLPEAIDAADLEEFDVAVVDSMMREADTLCRHISASRNVPVLAMIRGADVDWKKLQSLNADGYIPQDIGPSEFLARVRAILRRGKFSTTQKHMSACLPEPVGGGK